jgi:hypothetical protein
MVADVAWNFPVSMKLGMAAVVKLNEKFSLYAIGVESENQALP